MVASNSNQLSLAQVKGGLLKNIRGKLKATKDGKYNSADFAETDLVSLEPVTPSLCFPLYLYSICQLGLCVN